MNGIVLGFGAALGMALFGGSIASLVRQLRQGSQRRNPLIAPYSDRRPH
jgi:hypothetical protein